MAIVVVGTVAFDSVRTPSGEREDILGGSAAHFAVAASFFAPVRLVAVVGEDFRDEHRAPLLGRGVDLAGVVTAAGRTFRWAGEYGDDLNNPRTLETQLNVLATFDPRMPPGWENTPIVFLANVDPDLQSRFLDQVKSPRLVAADTMNFWIDSKADAIRRVLGRVDVLLINDAEIRQLTGRRNIVEAAEDVFALGPKVVVVKRGEHGVLVLQETGAFALPGYPLRRVVDPTGAGDAFAGGFLGWLASRPAEEPPDWRRASVIGSVLASYQVEDFSLERTLRLSSAEIESRYEDFRALTRFDALER